MKNVGGRPGGSITAAQFIGRFVDGCPWAHLDIAGTAWSSKDQPTAPKGATAWGVRLLDRMVFEHHEGTAMPVPVPAEPEEAVLSGAGSSAALLSEGEATPTASAAQPDLPVSSTMGDEAAKPRPGRSRKGR